MYCHPPWGPAWPRCCRETSGLFAADYDLTATRRVVRVSLVFIMGCLAWPLRVPSAHTSWGDSFQLCAHYLLPKCCHLLPSEKLAFPSQWTHLAFPTHHPIGRFWLSKITFWVDYTLSTASPNYSSVLRWSPNSYRNGAVSKMCAMRAWWQRMVAS